MRYLFFIVIFITTAIPTACFAQSNDITNVAKGESAPYAGVLMPEEDLSYYLQLQNEVQALKEENASLKRELSTNYQKINWMADITNYQYQRVTLYYDFYKREKRSASLKTAINIGENTLLVIGSVAATIGLLKLAQKVQ
jgi:hypothetical protein